MNNQVSEIVAREQLPTQVLDLVLKPIPALFLSVKQKNAVTSVPRWRMDK